MKTIRTKAAFLVCVLAQVAAAHAQPPAQAERKQARALRVAGGTIRVDGRLDEETWERATPVGDFVQKEPTEGLAPTDAIDVRFIYDEEALYVGARMATTRETAIQAPLGRRDVAAQAEHFLVSFDTFLDHRTAVTFGVTAAGVRIDRFHPDDNEETFDAGFDPVWEARTSRTADGWVAELWIPFSQLRFSAQVEQVWGVNMYRFRPTLDEGDYWVLIPRTERFWASRFGELRGISGVRPTKRVEILPYMASASTVHANRDTRNPFDDGKNLEGRLGADVKVGLGPNLTLDATVNPDFGQVEADPAEVNLTAFETRFPEKRPFFLEGAPLFDIGHPNFYYSRRIGARPTGPASGDFVDYPASSTILVAAKLTGRLPSRTSIGLLTAVTDDEAATVASLLSPDFGKVPVAPRTYRSVGRIRQEFGQSGSTIGFFATGMHRDFAGQDPLADLLTTNAVAVAGDTLIRIKQGEYQFRMAGGGSFLNGTAKAVERFQRASSHYAQRPDKTHAILDPTRTSLSGFTTLARFDRLSGTHWLWNASMKVDSAFFETNDFANLNGGDGIQPGASLTWRETRPGRALRSYSFAINPSAEWNFGGDLMETLIRPSANVTWSNFWTTSVSYTERPRAKDDALTRGGPLMQTPRGWSTTVTFGNRATSQTRVTGAVVSAGNEDGGSTKSVTATLSFRPGPRWQLSVSPFYDRVTDTQQYVSTVTGGGRAETYTNRYVLAFIDRSTASTAFRLGLTVRPDMNLDVYAEPFAASGRYYDFGELLVPGGRERLTYGATTGTSLTTLTDGTRSVVAGDRTFALPARDFNTLSFRSNVVLRWEWRPGSTVYLVWQQDRSESQVLGSRVGLGDMFRSASAPGSNFFIVKTSFWLPLK